MMHSLNGGILPAQKGYRAAVVTTRGAVVVVGIRVWANRNLAAREAISLIKVVAK